MGHINHIHEGNQTTWNDQGHWHDHIHTGSQAESTADRASNDEVKALLTFMIHHNAHHTEELANMLDRLPPTAKRKMMIAIGSFEAANVDLQAVIDCLN